MISFLSFFLSFFFIGGVDQRRGVVVMAELISPGPALSLHGRYLWPPSHTHTHTHTPTHPHTHTHTHTHRPQSPALIIRRVVWVGGWRWREIVGGGWVWRPTPGRRSISDGASSDAARPLAHWKSALSPPQKANHLIAPWPSARALCRLDFLFVDWFHSLLLFLVFFHVDRLTDYCSVQSFLLFEVIISPSNGVLTSLKWKWIGWIAFFFWPSPCSLWKFGNIVFIICRFTGHPSSQFHYLASIESFVCSFVCFFFVFFSLFLFSVVPPFFFCGAGRGEGNGARRRRRNDFETAADSFMNSIPKCKKV